MLGRRDAGVTSGPAPQGDAAAAEQGRGRPGRREAALGARRTPARTGGHASEPHRQVPHPGAPRTRGDRAQAGSGPGDLCSCRDSPVRSQGIAPPKLTRRFCLGGADSARPRSPHPHPAVAQACSPYLRRCPPASTSLQGSPLLARFPFQTPQDSAEWGSCGWVLGQQGCWTSPFTRAVLPSFSGGAETSAEASQVEGKCGGQGLGE